MTVQTLESKHLKPPLPLNMEEYAETFCEAYRVGHAFILNDIREEQIYQDEQMAFIMAEDEETLSSDEALAKQLQEEFNNETPLKPEKKVIKPWKTDNSSKGRGQTSVTPNEVPKEKVPKPDVKPNIDVQQIVAEIKENFVPDVKHSVSKEVVSIFQHMFSRDMQSVMVMLKSKKVHATLGMLSEIGSAPETSKIALCGLRWFKLNMSKCQKMSSCQKDVKCQIVKHLDYGGGSQKK